MFDLKKSYSFDKEAAENGAKMPIGEGPEDYILICRLPNKKYTAELTKVMLANGKVLDFLKLQDADKYEDKDRELQAGVLAKTIVIGWGKNFGEGGKKLVYSVKTCAKILLDYPDFRADCVVFASDVANYPAQIDLDDVKKKS